MKFTQLHWALVLLLIVGGFFLGNVLTDKYLEKKNSVPGE